MTGNDMPFLWNSYLSAISKFIFWQKLSKTHTLLLGQGVLPKNIDQISLKNKEAWNSNLQVWESIIKMSVPIREDINILTQKPHLI